MAGTAQELFPNRTGGVRPRRTRTPSNVPVGRPAARACSATRPSPRLSSTARPTQIRGHPRTLAASPSVIAHESQQTPAAGPRSANGRAREAFSRVPSRRPATRPGLGGRSQGAIPGATGGRYQATQGDAPRQSVQLNGLQSDARRRTATHRRCLLSSGSRVRILPGAPLPGAPLPGAPLQGLSGELLERATPWVRDGSLKHKEDIVDGLENAPEAFSACWTARTSASSSSR